MFANIEYILKASVFYSVKPANIYVQERQYSIAD